MALSWKEKEICVEARAWLKEEKINTFEKEFMSREVYKSPVYAHNRVDRITKLEVPAIWKKFQHYRSIRRIENDTDAVARLRLQAAQRLLGMWSLTQSAYIWQQVADGGEAETGFYTSFQSVDNYLRELTSRQSFLPAAVHLSDTLPHAVDEITGMRGSYDRVYPALRAVVGLAIRGLSEQQVLSQPVVFPEPLHSFGDIKIWDRAG